MLLFTLWTVPRSLGLLVPFAIMIIASLGFGFLWVWMTCRMLGKLVRRLYDGDPALVPPPPAGDYRCRLMCSLLVSRIAVGGHPYAGPSQWIFIPHGKNLARHRHPTTLWTSGGLKLTTKPTPARKLARMLGVPSNLTLDVNTATGVATLQLPEAERAAARLRHCSDVDATKSA